MENGKYRYLYSDDITPSKLVGSCPNCPDVKISGRFFKDMEEISYYSCPECGGDLTWRRLKVKKSDE